jgi:hypothetical protein
VTILKSRFRLKEGETGRGNRAKGTGHQARSKREIKREARRAGNVAHGTERLGAFCGSLSFLG